MITNTKFYKENKEGIVWGLVVGLVRGLVWGLVFGLVSGLVVILINFARALPFINGFIPILILVLLILFLVEIFFWLDKSKPDKSENITKFTLKKKFEAFCEVVLGLSGVAQIYILIREGIKHITKEVFMEILKWTGYIGAGIIALGIIVLIVYGWIKLNERKYRK